MTHKFVIELTDDCKGYEQDVDYLERIYGAGPIKEHDEEIYNKAIDDFAKLVKKYNWNIRNRNANAFIYGAIDKIAEQLKAGVSNGTDNQ